MINNSIFSLKKRLLAIFLLVSFLFLAIICRLFYLQIIKGAWLQAKAIDQWTRELPLNAIRGEFTDRNGVTLATNYSTYDIYVRPSMVSDARLVTSKLVEVLGVDYETTYTRVTDRYVSESLIKLQVPKDKAKLLKSDELIGIKLSENNTRYYPYQNMLTQVLGYTTIDNVGQAGLEAYYNKYLTGINGYIIEESDVKGVKIDNTLTTYMPSIPGCSIELTIDINIQRFTENALKILVDEQKPKRASAIVMNPNTGEIVSMCSYPNFNLNSVPRDDVATLLETTKNMNIVDVYEPGSTFKCITMANSINVGTAHLSDHFYDPGYRMVDGEKIKCWKLKGHGSQTLSQGLANSCNSVFVDLALRLGKDGIYQMFDRFGLGKPLGIDFLGEGYGIIMDYDIAKNVDVARMGFGQAVAVTPIQLISAICSIVNGGTLFTPYFMKSMYDAYGNIMLKNEPKAIRNTISQETSEIMQTMMLDVIKQYSGYYAFIPGYEVGGKTGTSQKYENGKINGQYIASFVGTFPAHNPDYVVLIIVDEPGGASYYGSIAATPYAKMIIQDIIKYKKYEPSSDIALETDQYNQKVVMPNVIGKDVDNAINIIENIGLQVEIQGEGDVVISQFPIVDTEVIKNGIVMIQTD